MKALTGYYLSPLPPLPTREGEKRELYPLPCGEGQGER